MSDTSSSKRLLNGVKAAAPKKSKSNASDVKAALAPDKPAKKSTKKKIETAVQKPVASKKQKIKGNKSNAASLPSSEPNNNSRKNRKNKPSLRRSNVDLDDDSSVEDEEVNKSKDYSNIPPEIGDEVAIKCPADPPYPEGWYSGVVIDIMIHGHEGAKIHAKGEKVKNYTLQIEWDGGGVEDLRNPEWRMKGDEPDKQGKISHRDAKLRPYFKYWVNRLSATADAERRLSRTRAGKNTRIDPDQKMEWIKCSNPNCGKWRPLPLCLKSSSVLETCEGKWYCVLNTWDEAMSSCSAPQETGYMPEEK